MTRTLDDALVAAYERGALLSQHRAYHYRAHAREHGDEATVALLDSLHGIPALAAAGRAAGGTVMAGRYRDAQPAAAVPPGADPALFAANPILAEMRSAKPALVAAAMAEDPNPPQLFGDADYPAFTASGLPVSVLASLPWPLRRPVAQAPDLAAAYQLVDKYAGVPDMAKVDLAFSPANRAYVEAMSQWLIGTGQMPADLAPGASTGKLSGLSSYTTDQLHREIFGQSSTG
jgi:hypothetical protein